MSVLGHALPPRDMARVAEKVRAPLPAGNIGDGGGGGDTTGEWQLVSRTQAARRIHQRARSVHSALSLQLTVEAALLRPVPGKSAGTVAKQHNHEAKLNLHTDPIFARCASTQIANCMYCTGPKLLFLATSPRNPKRPPRTVWTE
jgi:hypothetical protein